MTKSARYGRAGMTAAAAVLGLWATASGAQAQAQTTPAANNSGQALGFTRADAQKMVVAPVNATNQALGQIAQKLSKDSGVAVVTDSSLLAVPVTFTSLGGGLDTVMGQMTKVLPSGATIRAALVPDTGAVPDGDAVAALLRAQDAFAAKPAAAATTAAPAATPTFTPGKFDLLGQQVTLDEAATKIADLHLRPVYVIVRNRPATDPVSKLTAMQAEAMKAWTSMTPDQQKQAMQIQFNAMMNGTPADRQAMIGQMIQQGSYMMQMMGQMPPEQQKQVQQEFMSALSQSGLMPPGGMGGGPARRRPQ